jgi:hypothetical protein
LYRSRDTILHSIQGISDKLGIVSALVSIFQNWRVLSLYDAHKYPYKYLPTANLTPLLVTALFSIFTHLIATIVITAACPLIQGIIIFHKGIIEYKRFGYAYE